MAAPPPGNPPMGRAPTQPGPPVAMASQSRGAEVAPAPKRRKKRKLSDKHVVEKTRAFLPESQVFSQLVEFEQRIDAVVERKRLEFQDMLRNLDRVPATLRVRAWCEKTPEGFVVRVAGRLVKVTSDNTTEDIPDAPAMSQFLTKLQVVIGEDAGSAPSWAPPEADTRSRSPPPRFANFEVRRDGPVPEKAHVLLHVKHEPEVVLLPESLAELFGVPHCTRATAAASLWSYIKQNRLQSASDPSIVEVDDILADALSIPANERRVKLTALAHKLTTCLGGLPPVRIEVRMPSGTGPELVHDVEVSLPAASRAAKAADWIRVAGEALTPTQEEDDEDRRIAKAVAQIHERLRRRAFYLGFAHSPADFIAGLCASQARDLRVMAVGQSRGSLTGQHARAGFFAQPWAEEAAMRYLRRGTS